MGIPFLWDMTQREWVVGSRRFETTYCPPHQGSIGPRRINLSVFEYEGHYVASKRRNPLAHSRSVVSHKNGILP